MSDETVMQAADRQLADTGLHAVTPGSVERLRAERDEWHRAALVAGDRAMTMERERDEARAEVERLRAERDEVGRWLRQWRDDGWRPATPGHDWLDEWMDDEGASNDERE